MADYVTKDSGQRVDFPSGMRRDIADDKPNFSLCLAEGVPFEEQLLTRWAALMQRGAKKYGDRNWEQANSVEELERFRSSALRHMIQWATGAAPEEDHAAAVVFNLAAYEATKRKLQDKPSEPLVLRDGARVRISDPAYNNGAPLGREGVASPSDSTAWAWSVLLDNGEEHLYMHAHELEVIG
jgi:hypothetical protein